MNLGKNKKLTPKGTAPMPMRRTTKHKRPLMDLVLQNAAELRRARREAGKLGDSNARE